MTFQRRWLFAPLSLWTLLHFSALALAESYDPYPTYDRSSCGDSKTVFVVKEIALPQELEPTHQRVQDPDYRDTRTCAGFSAQLALQYLYNKEQGLHGERMKVPSIVDLLGYYHGGQLCDVNSVADFALLDRVRRENYSPTEDYFEAGKGDFERTFEVGHWENLPSCRFDSDEALLRSWIEKSLSSQLKSRLKENPSDAEVFEDWMKRSLADPFTAAYQTLARHPLRSRLHLPRFNIKLMPRIDHQDLGYKYGKPETLRAAFEQAFEQLQSGYPIITHPVTYDHSTVITGARQVCCGLPEDLSGADCHYEYRIFDSLKGRQTGDRWYVVGRDFIGGESIQVLPCFSDRAPFCQSAIIQPEKGEIRSEIELAFYSDDLERFRSLFPVEENSSNVLEKVFQYHCPSISEWVLENNLVSQEQALFWGISSWTSSSAKTRLQVLSRNQLDLNQKVLGHYPLEGVNSSIQNLYMLKKFGANLSLVDERGWGLYSWGLNSAPSRCQAYFEALGNEGVDPNLQKIGNESVLKYAVSMGYLTAVRALCGNGANPDLPEEDGKTARKLAEDLARTESRPEYKEILGVLQNHCQSRN